jgi:hypothetical protein
MHDSFCRFAPDYVKFKSPDISDWLCWIWEVRANAETAFTTAIIDDASVLIAKSYSCFDHTQVRATSRLTDAAIAALLFRFCD